MKRFSVCYISFGYYQGQGTTHLFEYSRNLVYMGHQASVIVAGRRWEKKSEVLDGVQIWRVPVKSIDKRSLENIRFSSLVRVLLKKIENEVDIIHVFSHLGVSLIKIGRLKSSARWICDIRSGPLGVYTDYRLVKFFQKLERSLFDATFVIDEAVRDFIFGSNNCGQTFIVPNGVDLNNFRPISSRNILRRYGVEEKDIVLVYLGTLDRRRRIECLIQAFWKASQTVDGLRLLILGEGNRSNYLKLLAKKMGISNRVLFMGFVNYLEVPQFLSTADIGISYVPIIPSFEAQPPLKAMEYLACGLPVIATETIGNKRFIIDGENGLLTKDDAKSVSKAIIRLALDGDLRKTMANRARDSIAKYDWRIIVRENLIPAYKRVLEG